MEGTEEYFAKEMFPGMDFAEEEKSLLKEEMNGMLKNMDKEELKHFFSKEEFDENYKLIELNKYPFEKALMLLKHVGYNNAKKLRDHHCLTDISLKKRFIRMIVEEGKKKDGNDERLLVDLCECYLFYRARYVLINDEILLTCVKCLLKVALNKEENKEARKEVEIALLALGDVRYFDMSEELYLNEIKEIVQYNQDHHNLTHLAYQSAWQFLFNRFFGDKMLEIVIVNELHFITEATRELEKLTRSVDWQIKDDDKRGKETEDVNTLRRWLHTLEICFEFHRMQNEELVELVCSIIQIFRAAKGYYGYICDLCYNSMIKAVKNKAVKIDCLLKGGTVDLFSEEMNQSTLKDAVIWDCSDFFMNISERQRKKTDGHTEEEERKATKMEVFEKMEEEGYEDIITSFLEIFYFLNNKYFSDFLSFNIFDYFVNA
ncbi:uncharacterized protein MONOS_18587 [Monocercomonoides exilis]|uniref:uncharacterized protein n=1 Tax=Monocercomonoides exilis TaxID=2049356 RepID=UPI00355ACAEE|nr:hypothetical protein MONOS_18587 [Monocercomonoides exilis]